MVVAVEVGRITTSSPLIRRKFVRVLEGGDICIYRRCMDYIGFRRTYRTRFVFVAEEETEGGGGCHVI